MHSLRSIAVQYTNCGTGGAFELPMQSGTYRDIYRIVIIVCNKNPISHTTSSNTGKSVVPRSHRGSNSHALGVILIIWPSITPNILMPKIDAHSQNFLLLTMLH